MQTDINGLSEDFILLIKELSDMVCYIICFKWNVIDSKESNQSQKYKFSVNCSNGTGALIAHRAFTLFPKGWLTGA